VIEAHRLSKVYSRGVYALRDLSLTIDKGEFMFLTGSSGAGKSTLLRLLLREDLPTDGSLTVNGRDVGALRGSDIQAYRRTIGFVFQDFRLIPRFTVFQNVAFVMRVLGIALGVQQRKTFQVLKWVGLQHRMNAHPEELSGGEQQRVPSRALVNDPQLVPAAHQISIPVVARPFLFREIARGAKSCRDHDRGADSARRPARHHARPRTPRRGPARPAPSLRSTGGGEYLARAPVCLLSTARSPLAVGRQLARDVESPARCRLDERKWLIPDDATPEDRPRSRCSPQRPW
jgi:cell division transport system ATP-binding protein